MNLSQEQVRFFRHSGYIKLPWCVPEATVNDMRRVVGDCLRARKEPIGYDNQGRAVRVSNVLERDPIFRQVFTSDTILDPLESLLGPNIELALNRHNHATITPKDLPFPRLHRDVLQWTRSVVTVIVYLEQSTTENGCTEIIPGSHYLPFVGTPNNGGTWMDEHSVYADLMEQALPIPMPSGGILIFDSLAFHRVGVNRTDSLRMSVTMAYHSVDELSGISDPHRLLVRGERLYRGNDKAHISSDKGSAS